MKLKRGAKLFLKVGDEIFGPFKWQMVREWMAMKFIPDDALIGVSETGDYMEAREIEDLVNLPASMTSPDSIVNYYLYGERLRDKSTPRQHTYAKTLGCPFITTAIDWHLLCRVLGHMETAFPDRAIVGEMERCEEERTRLYREGPASEAQVKYLKSIGVANADRLSREEAHKMISGPVTEGQLRRLKFYGLHASDDLCKDEASRIIDDYKTHHPESEELYQAWKAKNGITGSATDSAPNRTSTPYRNAPSTNSAQSKTSLPAMLVLAAIIVVAILLKLHGAK